jgi:predicted nucleic acid-binding Zn ribbon protein
MKYTKECPTCKEDFTTDVHNKKYCSEHCSREKWAEMRRTGNRSVYPNKYFKNKHCRWCSDLFTPRGPSNHYCSEECSKKGQKDTYYLRNYDIGYREYLTLLDSNNGGCWKCDKSKEDNTKLILAVDHNHKTGQVRGLLCTDCNMAIGKLGDDIKGLREALNYLEQAEERK